MKRLNKKEWKKTTKYIAGSAGAVSLAVGRKCIHETVDKMQHIFGIVIWTDRPVPVLRNRVTVIVQIKCIEVLGIQNLCHVGLAI